jgi:hypothetical protein
MYSFFLFSFVTIFMPSKAPSEHEGLFIMILDLDVPWEYINYKNSVVGYVMRGGDGAVICSGYGTRGGRYFRHSMPRYIVACLQALQWATEQKVVLETDAMMVVQAANYLDFDRSSASGLLRDLKESLFCNFTSTVVAYNSHFCNLLLLTDYLPLGQSWVCSICSKFSCTL